MFIMLVNFHFLFYVVFQNGALGQNIIQVVASDA